MVCCCFEYFDYYGGGSWFRSVSRNVRPASEASWEFVSRVAFKFEIV